MGSRKEYPHIFGRCAITRTSDYSQAFGIVGVATGAAVTPPRPTHLPFHLWDMLSSSVVGRTLAHTVIRRSRRVLALAEAFTE